MQNIAIPSTGIFRILQFYKLNSKKHKNMGIWTVLWVASANTETSFREYNTVKILKIGTPEIITIIVLQLEQLDFTVQMQTE